jgi:Flp pilus assembly pilin Flp
MKRAKAIIRRTRRSLQSLHQDEQGADALEKLLIIAAIVLPLLGLLIFFRDELNQWVTDWWEKIKGQGDQDLTS